MAYGLDDGSKNPSAISPGSFCSEEEYKAKIKLSQPYQVPGADEMDDDEALIAEYDAPDDDSVLATNFNSTQRQLLTTKKPLENNSNLLNNVDFREAYLK